MATMTKLFEKITANDYEWLESLVQSKKEVNWNCIRYGKSSLISKALEVRALECFKILIEIPELTIFSNSSGMINGLMKALEYYTEAPNQSNEYYLNKLLEKNVVVSSYMVIQSIDNNKMFNMLFNRLEKKEGDIKSIISSIISRMNLNLLKSVYDFLETNYLPYYTINYRLQFNTYIFEKYCVSLYDSNNAAKVHIVEYIVSKGVSWKTINNVPTIYYICRTKNDHIYNYFLNLYQSLPSEELNMIPGIKNFDISYIDNYYYNTSDVTSIKRVIDIINLPINFNDSANEIIDIFKKIFNYHNSYSVNSTKALNCYVLMFLLFNKGIVKTSPFIYLSDIDMKTLKTSYQYATKNNDNYKNYCHFIRMFKYINNHFNFKMPETSYDTFKQAFTSEQPINEELEEKELITKINDIINPPKKVVVKKPRASRAKVKVVKNEIEV